MANWPLGDVDALIQTTLANDSTIKTLMGISSGVARVAGYRVPRGPNWLLFIYYYSIPGVAARVNGNETVLHSPDYDIEVRTVGAPTNNSEAIVDRIDVLMKLMKAQLTPGGLWVVSATLEKEISLVTPGETEDVYYTRRGGTYKLQVSKV